MRCSCGFIVACHGARPGQLQMPLAGCDTENARIVANSSRAVDGREREQVLSVSRLLCPLPLSLPLSLSPCFMLCCILSGVKAILCFCHRKEKEKSVASVTVQNARKKRNMRVCTTGRCCVNFKNCQSMPRLATGQLYPTKTPSKLLGM